MKSFQDEVEMYTIYTESQKSQKLCGIISIQKLMSIEHFTHCKFGT